MTANERLLDAAIHRAIDTHQYSEGVVRRLVSMLNGADADIFAALTSALERMPADSFTVARLEALLQSVRAMNDAVYARIGGDLAAQMRAFGAAEAAFQVALFGAAIPAEVLARLPLMMVTAEQVYAAVVSRPFQGRLLSEWASSIADDRMRRIREAIRVGYVSNETNAQIMARIRGTRALRYSDGIIEIDRRSLRSVVNTAVSHTAATARGEFYRANMKLIAAEQWVSTLDSRTTHICQARDGKRYTADAHKPIGHDLPWLGGPGRAHFNCRSTSVPVTRSWKDLGIDMPEFSPATRASMDGQVPADLTYGEWLKKQSPKRQDEVLGASRAALFRSGGLPIEKFVNDKGKLLTLASITNVTARYQAQQAMEKALEEKTVLLGEVHHRVKNNLQVISSLLNLQARSAAEPVRVALVESQNHVKSMALIHLLLYERSDFSRVPLTTYLERLLMLLQHSLADSRLKVSVHFTPPPQEVYLELQQSIPLGLLVNEIVTNVFKHAFAGRGHGTLRLQLLPGEPDNQLCISDDGVGLPADVVLGESQTLGFQLLPMLAEQLQGRVAQFQL